MCGIFGQISSLYVNKNDIKKLAKHAGQRGRDACGLITYEKSIYKVYRSNCEVDSLLKKVKPFNAQLLLGHSRLITNGLNDNQPVVRNDNCVIHNGIILNEESVWKQLGMKRQLQIDSELILAIAEDHLTKGLPLDDIPQSILNKCEGVVACALLLARTGKLFLFSNNGSLYVGENKNGISFASEKFALQQISCKSIKQIKLDSLILDVPKLQSNIVISEQNIRKKNIIPCLKFNKTEEGLLEFKQPNIRRCSRCILPETMPFISFDSDGVCNYCRNYKLRNVPKPKNELFDLVKPYLKKNGNDCIVPFSGGRDSCYALHLIVNELKMKPITYTYDWGMITDLGRRNISRMCSVLGVENIIVAANIEKKRCNIAMNLSAWLKSPNLGMISVLTSGDKHFFKYVETVKKQTGIKLNLWGINPLEVTHFKSGFLGIKPDFEEKRVYSHGVMKQFKYQFLRFKAMLESLGYFNSSLIDTLSGEYYRSFTAKRDYFHIFDYWRWDEKVIENTLDDYNWERAIDTNVTWRIGDGTTAFYNYIYYTVVGFTEHDTFRSNQIREGDLTRSQALKLVADENRPRYPNIRWYLDTLGFSFSSVIKTINSIPKLYN